MKLGTLYRVKSNATQEGRPLKRFFCFENDTGRFIGYSASDWPIFSHSKNNGGRPSESVVNCNNPDDILEEVKED